jgi:hypothetical protein
MVTVDDGPQPGFTNRNADRRPFLQTFREQRIDDCWMASLSGDRASPGPVGGC